MTRFFNLIRALFPQWSFFDRVSYQFELQYKKESDQWQPLVFEVHRPRGGILLNAVCNMTLAQIHLLEYFVRDVQEMGEEEFQRSSNYQMLFSLVMVKLRQIGITSGQTQFRIRAFDENESLEIFVSDIFNVEAR